jgi:hypothetical protein
MWKSLFEVITAAFGFFGALLRKAPAEEGEPTSPDLSVDAAKARAGAAAGAAANTASHKAGPKP